MDTPRRTPWLAVFAGLAITATGAAVLVRSPVVERARAVGDALTAEPESVMSADVYKHYRARRDEVESMRRDLRRLVTAESAFMATSGRAASSWDVHFGRAAPGVIGPTIHVTRGGWWAWVSNTHTPITCAVAVGDTTIEHARSGEPVCLGGSAPWWR